MVKIEVTFYSIYCELSTTKNYGKFNSDHKTKWWHSHGIYEKSDIIVISNFLKLPLTFLEVTGFFFFLLEKKRLLNYNEKCLLNSFIHYYYFLKKTSHLTPGLGLCNILGKRQIRQFLASFWVSRFSFICQNHTSE